MFPGKKSTANIFQQEYIFRKLDFFQIFTHCVGLFCGNKQHVVIEGAKAIFIQP